MWRAFNWCLSKVKRGSNQLEIFYNNYVKFKGASLRKSLMDNVFPGNLEDMVRMLRQFLHEDADKGIFQDL